MYYSCSRGGEIADRARTSKNILLTLMRKNDTFYNRVECLLLKVYIGVRNNLASV